MNLNLSKEVKISSAVTPTAGVADTADIEGTVLDMGGFEGVCAVVRMGAITGNAVTSIKMQGGDLANGSDMTDLEGTGQTIADDADDKVFYIDVAKPINHRYLRLYVDRGTQNAVVADAVYLQYGPHHTPVTHGTNVSGETHIGPAEGTA